MDIAKNFQRIYLGDSLISRIDIDIPSAVRTLYLNGAFLLREGSNPDTFDPEEMYSPASLTFTGVLSISCPEGAYSLNSTIVDFEAVDAQNGLDNVQARKDRWIR